MAKWVLALTFLVLAGCGGSSGDPANGGQKKAQVKEITVFAAASLTDVVNDLKAALEKSGEYNVKASFGATSDLARQIIEGAPADVFISADQDWMNKVREKGGLDGRDRVIARNTLVCVAPKDGAKASKPTDLKALEFPRLAIADENVPAGKYARAALKFYSVHDEFKSRFVGQKDVRAVLRAVSTGECDAGFVYATDAKADQGVSTLFTFEQKSYPFIVYPAAVCSGSNNKEAARALLEYLLSKEAQTALAARGFGPGETP
jgi:molybdate transport system substrate-binding protein